jgi:hypothetical protein
MRHRNAQLAVDLYNRLHEKHNWSPPTAWHGIARLLLTCNVWGRGWEPFHDVVVYRERNDLVKGQIVRDRTEALSLFLAQQLGVTRSNLCYELGTYWRQPTISELQPHNPVGIAYRSLIVNALELFGDRGVTYDEEADRHREFPRHSFPARSGKSKVHILARKRGRIVALLSTQWRSRHNRVRFINQSLAYAAAARRENPNCSLYAVVGEFTPSRLDKILNCQPAIPNAALYATVHFEPRLITEGLRENGRMTHLKSLEWLIEQSFLW